MVLRNLLFPLICLITNKSTSKKSFPIPNVFPQNSFSQNTATQSSLNFHVILCGAKKFTDDEIFFNYSSKSNNIIKKMWVNLCSFLLSIQRQYKTHKIKWKSNFVLLLRNWIKWSRENNKNRSIIMICLQRMIFLYYFDKVCLLDGIARRI